MKDQITFEELTPFLPYGLEMLNTKSGRIIHIIGMQESVSCIRLFTSEAEYQADIWPLKPILKSLSDISEELFEEIGFANEEDFQECVKNGDILHNNWIKLVKQHFDVFGWIERGLAIDINTLNQE